MKSKLFVLLFGLILISKFASGIETPPCLPDTSCDAPCGGTGFCNGDACFMDSSCTLGQECGASCAGGAPEMPFVMRGLIPLFVIAGTAFLIKRKKKKKNEK